MHQVFFAFGALHSDHTHSTGFAYIFCHWFTPSWLIKKLKNLSVSSLNFSTVKMSKKFSWWTPVISEKASRVFFSRIKSFDEKIEIMDTCRNLITFKGIWATTGCSQPPLPVIEVDRSVLTRFQLKSMGCLIEILIREVTYRSFKIIWRIKE